jgi:hypothetical protein
MVKNELCHVEPGDVWGVGAHRLACTDCLAANFVSYVRAQSSLPTYSYTDPPWGQGVLTMFNNKAVKDGGIAGAIADYRAWLFHFCVMLKATGVALAFVEIGQGDAAKLEQAARESGLGGLARWAITYYKTRPAWLYALGEQIPQCGLPDLEGLDDSVTPSVVTRWALRQGCPLILDPCTGRGLTPECVALSGGVFLGCELNPQRVAFSLRRLAELTGHRIFLEGRLP